MEVRQLSALAPGIASRIGATSPRGIGAGRQGQRGHWRRLALQGGPPPLQRHWRREKSWKKSWKKSPCLLPVVVLKNKGKPDGRTPGQARCALPLYHAPVANGVADGVEAGAAGATGAVAGGWLAVPQAWQKRANALFRVL